MKEPLFILLLLAAGCTIKKNRVLASTNPIPLSKKTKEELIKQADASYERDNHEEAI